MILTEQNYFTPEADKEYMSVSLFKSFQECQAATMARIRSEWHQEPSESMLLGSYVHAHFSGDLEQFKAQHPEMISSKGPTKGELKVGFQKAHKMIETLEKDEFCKFVLAGEKEKIITAELFGVPWKTKIDVLTDKRIVDLKTTKNIYDLSWNPVNQCKETFIEKYQYLLQAAIYSEVERIASNSDKWKEFLFVVVSSEEEPDKAIIAVDDDLLIEHNLRWAEGQLQHIIPVWKGEQEPERCGKCAYCRSTKKITKVTRYSDFVRDLVP